MPDDTAKIKSINKLSDILLRQGDSKSALDYTIKAIKISETISNKDNKSWIRNTAKAHYNLAIIYEHTGRYPESIKEALYTLKMFEKIDFQIAVGACYIQIGIVYADQDDYEKALENYFYALETYKKIDHKGGMAAAYNDIGVVYYSQRKIDQALENYNQSMKLYKEVADQDGVAHCLSSIGDCHVYKGDFANGLEYYFSSLKIFNELGAKSSVASVYSDIGVAYYKKMNYAEARKYLEKSLPLLLETQSLDNVKVCYKRLARVVSAQGDYLQAFENYKNYILFRDSLYNEENTKKTVQAQMNFDFEKKEANLKAEQEKKDAITTAVAKKQKVIIWSVIFGLAVSILLAGFIFRSLKMTRKQKKLIENQKQEAEKQKEIITEKNKDISDSINYAKRIQEAIFPDKEIKYRIFPDAFVLFQPKDVVSGDFPWFSEKNGRRLIAAADCTGHGVPGAFMSMIGSAFLNEIVNERGIVSPDEILGELRFKIIKALKQTGAEGEQKDGMDIALLSFDDASSTVEYCGAYNTLWFFRKGEFAEYGANKRPIGYHQGKGLPFVKHTIPVQKGDSLYIFTDGFADQFGGPKGKKFRYKQLQEKLMQISQKPMLQQEEILTKTFQDWKGDLEQIDDVLVIGIRV